MRIVSWADELHFASIHVGTHWAGERVRKMLVVSLGPISVELCGPWRPDSRGTDRT